jgi:hypothetical protein
MLAAGAVYGIAGDPSSTAQPTFGQQASSPAGPILPLNSSDNPIVDSRLGDTKCLDSNAKQGRGIPSPPLICGGKSLAPLSTDGGTPTDYNKL